MERIYSKILFILLLFSVLIHNNLIADIPSFDIAEIEIKNQKYYLTYESTAVIGNDLCYYSYDNEYLYDGTELIDKILSRQEVELYEELHELKLEKFSNYSSEKLLYILKKKKKVNSVEEYDLLKLTKGNTYGYIYTEQLSNEDNYWIEDYPIEQYFGLSDYELCDMNIYGIEGNLLDSEQKKLKQKLNKLLKEKKREEYFKELELLYKENIVMIGFCSC